MSTNVSDTGCVRPISPWKQLFEAALLERDQSLLPGRLRDARNAVLDRIEDSFTSAPLTERKLLLAALNTIGELQRLAQVDELPPTRPNHVPLHAA